MLAKHTESENTSYFYVPDRHVRGLQRRELTPRIIARFQAKYTRSEGCWLWQAGRYANGYGQFAIGRDRAGKCHNTQAHRVAYVIAKGDIPAGVVVMHSCDVRECVNPAHLSLGTQGDNVRDAATKGHYDGPRPHHRSRKLSDGDVIAIRTSFASGDWLARAYRVSKVTVNLIRRNLRRKAA